MKFYKEPEKEIPVVAETEVLVVGGGPAGIGAAIGASRAGAKVMLLEMHNVVGGIATAGMMSHWTSGCKVPLLDEIVERVNKRRPLNSQENNTKSLLTINQESLKVELLDMLLESGVELQLYTQVCDVIMEDNRIVGVITQSKSGREAIYAKVVIDCSGDGDVAFLAGADYTLGRQSDNRCQPVTLMFKIGGVDYNNAIFPGSFESLVDVPNGEIQDLARRTLPAPAGHVLLYKSIVPTEVCVNMTNVININGTDVRDLTKAEIICRHQMDLIVNFLRKNAPGYEDCFIASSAQQLGVRETRHVKCLYQMNEEDIVTGRLFDDWIAKDNHFNFDIHNVDGSGLDKDGAQKHFKSTGRYSISYRSCVPSHIDALLLAGRSIDGTHKAHSNYRVMPICLNVGFGVGTASAFAVKSDTLPRNIDIKKVQEFMTK